MRRASCRPQSYQKLRSAQSELAILASWSCRPARPDGQMLRTTGKAAALILLHRSEQRGLSSLFDTQSANCRGQRFKILIHKEFHLLLYIGIAKLVQPRCSFT